MGVPPDSDNSPTPSTASPQQDSDLALNSATSPADVDAVPDLPLAAEGDSCGPPDAPTQVQPSRVDIFITDEADRSWLSRLLSLKASWQKPHFSWQKPHFRRSAQDDPVTIEDDLPLPAAPAGDADRSLLSQPPRRSAYDEPVRIEGLSHLEKHLASLTALRDVYASLDQRLARVEEKSGMLPAMCVNIERQVLQANIALQRTEEALADRSLHGLCENIEARLERTEETFHRGEGAIAERLQELSACMATRLDRTEETFHRGEGVIAERLQELSACMATRFAGVEETLRRTPQSLTDSMLPSIETQFIQARAALQRTEEAVMDKTLRELCQNIDARLERTEDRLHRSEGIVNERLQELSMRMTRLAEAEKSIQRIEQIVSSRPVEQSPSRPLERPLGEGATVVDFPAGTHANSENRTSAGGGVRARVALVLSRFANIKQTNGRIQLPWVTGFAAPVLVLVAALAIGSLVKTSRSVTPENVTPLSTAARTSTPAAPVTNPGIGAPSSPEVMANGTRSTSGILVAAPQQEPSDGESPPTINRGPRYVGTLSITSVPSGASVSINGRPAGKTPLRLPRQRAGSLAVQIAHDGFERWSAAVLVPADQLTQVTANLRAIAR